MNASQKIECKATRFFPLETPYPVQTELMQQIQNVIDRKQIGIFESPTGTGKSLSLLSASLSQLHEQIQTENKEETLPQNTNHQFVKNTEEEQQFPDQVEDFVSTENLDRKKRKNERIKRLTNKIRKVTAKKRRLIQKSEKQNLLECFDDSNITEEDSSSSLEEEKENQDELSIQIIYASRTHSQLSQFVNEAKKIKKFSDLRCISLGSRKNLCVHERVSKINSISLQNETCLDMQQKSGKQSEDMEAVGRSSNTNAKSCPYNNRKLVKDFSLCAISKPFDLEDLWKLGKELKACPYYGSRKAMDKCHLITLPYNSLLHKSTRESLSLKIHNNIVIIDEAHNLTDALIKIHSASLCLNDIQTVHQQILLFLKKYQKRLNSHNLFNLRQILLLCSLLEKFFEREINFKYADKQNIIEKPLRYTKHFDNSKEPDFNKENFDEVNAKQDLNCQFSTSVQTINIFELVSNIDTLDLFKIVDFMKEFRFVQKLKNISLPEINSEQDSQDITDSTTSSKINGLTNFRNFITQLSNSNSNCRVIVDLFVDNCFNKDGEQSLSKQSSFKLIALNVSQDFVDIASKARSVILIGGTMQPFDLMINSLFEDNKILNKTIQTYVCDHVVSSSNFCVQVLSHDRSNNKFDFRFINKNNKAQILELGQTILDITSKVIKGGIIVFFTSFAYLETVKLYWQNNFDKDGSIWSKLAKKKPIFCEPRSSSQLDEIIQKYNFECGSYNQDTKTDLHTESQSDKTHKKHCRDTHGAILLCVVNGKMSEGINFSDDLARCVIMVGLPYPNISDPELLEKLNYFNKTKKSTTLKNQHSLSISHSNKDINTTDNHDYYLNVCMRAVNQSIGRSIRQKGDQASIILIDYRYATNRIQNRLSKQIRTKLFSQTKKNQSSLLTFKESLDSKPNILDYQQSMLRLKHFFKEKYFDKNDSIN